MEDRAAFAEGNDLILTAPAGKIFVGAKII